MASSSSSPSVEVERFPEGMDGGLVGVEEGALVLELEPMAGPESAAAKKKRKKKEREREKKAAAAAAAVSTSREMEDDKENKDTRRPEKKVPKHVREMQEALARRKEAEERANQEREERMRKEEEEQRREDQLLRLAEEARIRKKEREREKILKKKEAGLPVTAKQKEKQARIETFRNQILADSGVKLPSRSSSDDGAATKRPVYSTKKKGSKVNHEVNNGIDAQNAGDEEEEEVEEEDVLVEAVTAEEVESVAESSGSAAASALSRPPAHFLGSGAGHPATTPTNGQQKGTLDAFAALKKIEQNPIHSRLPTNKPLSLLECWVLCSLKTSSIVGNKFYPVETCFILKFMLFLPSVGSLPI